MEFCTKNFSFFQKKIKCSKQPKKQNKLNFYFSLSGVPNVRGGWSGSDVWDKVPKKNIFFDTFPDGTESVESRARAGQLGERTTADRVQYFCTLLLPTELKI